MNQSLKDRLENFDDLCPCLKEGCDKRHVRNGISVFRFFRNHVRENGEIGRPPLDYDQRPEYLRFIDTITKELQT